MSRINILDDRLINKIAAGEVVENPASVVKELCENSIDAGSTAITVEFAKGGTEYIRIVDNGCGMDGVDAKTAFIRHATSKIKDSEDLEHISTMGFRGEALASISEVAQVVLTTSTGDIGTEITMRGGILENIRQLGFPRGTTIEVRSLFFNVPARKKFLKSIRQETTNILELCQKLILAHPEISFKVVNNGVTEIRSVSGGKPIDAIKAIYGNGIENEVISISKSVGDITVSGYASKPMFTELNRKKQSFFVNGRYVKSPLISAALDEAFKGTLMINKYPWAVLYITLPYDSVDVNVHPQKTEVRFGDQRAVFTAVVSAVSSALDPDIVIPDLKLGEAEPVAKAPVGIVAEDVKISVTDKFDDEEDKPNSESFSVLNKSETKTSAEPRNDVVHDTKSDIKSVIDFTEKQKREQISDKTQNEEKKTLTETKAEPQKPYFSVNEIPQGFDSPITTSKEQISFIEPTKDALYTPEPEYKIIGVLWDTYIIVQSGENCYIIDQHAAHERYLFDKYTEEFKAKKVGIQQLLIPETVNAEPAVVDIIAENKETFDSLGFEVEPFGHRTILIRGVPSVACEASFSAVFEEAVELIKNNMSAENVLNDIVCQGLMKSACKHAVKGNQKLSEAEIKFILKAITELKGLTCPHGRPIAITISRKEMEKRFGRIQ